MKPCCELAKKDRKEAGKFLKSKRRRLLDPASAKAELILYAVDAAHLRYCAANEGK